MWQPTSSRAANHIGPEPSFKKPGFYGKCECGLRCKDGMRCAYAYACVSAVHAIIMFLRLQ